MGARESTPIELSFILPAHNEADVLGVVLDSVFEAGLSTGSPFEVIVACDGCTDETAEIARGRGATAVEVDHRQISCVRNAGAARTTGEIYFFVDGDTRISVEVVGASLRALSDGAVAGGGSPSFDGEVPLYARVLMSLTLRVFRYVRLAGGCYMFCTREAFEAVSGFDETVYASEEVVFANAIKRLRGRRSFHVVPGRIVTSGRKLRTHSAREIFGVIGRVALRGRSVLESRDELDIWYGARRPDPHIEDPGN